MNLERARELAAGAWDACVGVLNFDQLKDEFAKILVRETSGVIQAEAWAAEASKVADEDLAKIGSKVDITRLTGSCVFCETSFLSSGTSVEEVQEAILHHIANCPKHPLRENAGIAAAARILVRDATRSRGEYVMNQGQYCQLKEACE